MLLLLLLLLLLCCIDTLQVFQAVGLVVGLVVV
jgi:hypothetical protein